MSEIFEDRKFIFMKSSFSMVLNPAIMNAIIHCVFSSKDIGDDMSLCYKKLWKLLIDRDMTRADLRGATGIAPATIAKMSRGESVGASVLERICASMQCNIGDIVDYVPDVKLVHSDGGDKGGQAG